MVSHFPDIHVLGQISYQVPRHHPVYSRIFDIPSRGRDNLVTPHGNVNKYVRAVSRNISIFQEVFPILPTVEIKQRSIFWSPRTKPYDRPLDFGGAHAFNVTSEIHVAVDLSPPMLDLSATVYIPRWRHTREKHGSLWFSQPV